MTANLNSRSTVTAAGPNDQERLARILDEYLVAIEQGKSVSPEELLAKHPADAEQLRGYLSGLNLFHAAAVVPGRGLGDGGMQPIGVPASLQTVGDYRLVREIGRGGMGVVYEAWQLSLRRRVALKVLPFTSAHDAKQLGRFKNEAQAAAQVQHPNIVPVFAIGEDCGTNYYVMQLIEGQSLTSLLNALRCNGNEPCDVTVPNNALTYNSQRAGGYVETPTRKAAIAQPMRAADTADHIRVVARLGIQAAEALHAAHEYGIVHRDVKPSNLLLDEHGKLWVTDFGLARCRDEQGLTQSGDVLGTMRYMSPEQAQGRLSLIDHRTDIYSLGMTLYELATLNHPDDAAADVAKLFDRHRAVPKPLRHWNRYIAADFQTIVLKCLSEFPHERYATAKELAGDLQRFLEGQPILASPPSIITRVTKWAKRRRALVYSTAAVLAVAIVAIVASSVLLSRERYAAKEREITQLREESTELQRLYTRVEDELAAVPGAEVVSREMLRDGIQNYERFVREVGDDPLFTADVARANGMLGILDAKLGNRTAALDAHRKAVEAWEKLFAREPGNSNYARNLAMSLNYLALRLSDDGQPTEAVELLKRAVDLQTTSVAGSPASVEFAADLATTHSNLGLVYLKSNDRAAAASEFRQATENPLVNMADSEEARHTLAASYNNLAALEEVSDPAAAVDAYKKTIAFERELLKADPVSAVHKMELARAYSNLGALVSKNKDWANAEKCYSNAIEIQKSLTDASPKHAGFRSDLAISYNGLGMAQSRGGNLSHAEETLHKATNEFATLLSEHPNDAELLSHQGSVWNNLGMLLERQNRMADAATAYEKAIDLQSRGLSARNGSDEYRSLLSRHYFNYAHNLAAQNNFEESLRIVSKRKDLWRGVPERLFSVAEELAVLQHETAGKPNSEAIKKVCVQMAVAALREALDKGLAAERLRDASLAELADDADFRQLLEERKIGLSTPPKKNSPELSRVN